jgi:hypothetical protein
MELVEELLMHIFFCPFHAKMFSRHKGKTMPLNIDFKWRNNPPFPCESTSSDNVITCSINLEMN